jgi:hypothetical protein
MDVSLRGAVSIARRLQDPLAELVKIDPRSIGVGQYQHDVHQPSLRTRLDETVELCVNRVGVEINTASPALLGYVAGIGPSLARGIVEHGAKRVGKIRIAARAARGPPARPEGLRAGRRLPADSGRASTPSIGPRYTPSGTNWWSGWPASWAVGVEVAGKDDVERRPRLEGPTRPLRRPGDVGLPTLKDIRRGAAAPRPGSQGILRSPLLPGRHPEALGPDRPGMRLPGNRDQRGGIRGLRGRGGPPGRTGAHLRAGGPLREGSRRGRAGGPASHGDGAQAVELDRNRIALSMKAGGVGRWTAGEWGRLLRAPLRFHPALTGDLRCPAAAPSSSRCWPSSRPVAPRPPPRGGRGRGGSGAPLLPGRPGQRGVGVHPPERGRHPEGCRRFHGALGAE